MATNSYSNQSLVQQLAIVEITSVEQLRLLGTEYGFLKIKSYFQEADKDILVQIEEVIQGIPWNRMTQKRREEVMDFYGMVMKEEMLELIY